eukprot:EG_transcript_14359
MPGSPDDTADIEDFGEIIKCSLEELNDPFERWNDFDPLESGLDVGGDLEAEATAVQRFARAFLEAKSSYARRVARRAAAQNGPQVVVAASSSSAFTDKPRALDQQPPRPKRAAATDSAWANPFVTARTRALDASAMLEDGATCIMTRRDAGLLERAAPNLWLLLQEAIEEHAQASPAAERPFACPNLQRLGLHTVVAIGAVHTWDALRKSWALHQSGVQRFIDTEMQPSPPSQNYLAAPDSPIPKPPARPDPLGPRPRTAEGYATLCRSVDGFLYAPADADGPQLTVAERLAAQFRDQRPATSLGDSRAGHPNLRYTQPYSQPHDVPTGAAGFPASIECNCPVFVHLSVATSEGTLCSPPGLTPSEGASSSSSSSSSSLTKLQLDAVSPATVASDTPNAPAEVNSATTPVAGS